MYTDSHVHFDAFRGPGELEAALDRARDAGVTRMIAVGGNDETNEFALSVAERYPAQISAVIGCDRDEAGADHDLAAFRERLRRPGVVGVGEVGLDYHYHPETAAAQRKLFGEMLAAAREHHLPVAVHSREADDDTLALLREYGARGVLHCFTGSPAFAERLLDLGLMIGFSGILTFKNAGPLRDVAARAPEDRLLIETDTPYLAPEPFRGKPNEPALVAHVAAALAKIRNDSPEHIAHSTSHNAERLFALNRGRTP